MGEDGSEKKGQFLLRSALSFSCPLPSSSSLLVFFFIRKIRKEKWKGRRVQGMQGALFLITSSILHFTVLSISLSLPLSLPPSLPPSLARSLARSLSLSLSLPSRLLLHIPFSASLRLYVRLDIVDCPIPSPPPFPASRPSPSITQKEEGRFIRKRTRE